MRNGGFFFFGLKRAFLRAFSRGCLPNVKTTAAVATCVASRCVAKCGIGCARFVRDACSRRRDSEKKKLFTIKELGVGLKRFTVGEKVASISKRKKSHRWLVRASYATGKEFFRFTTNLTETIRNVHVDGLSIWAAGEYVSNMYVNCKDAHFFMSNDKINDLAIAPVILDDEKNPILACQDRFIRVVQGSDLYYEASVNGAATVIHHCEANDEGRRLAHGEAHPHAGRKEVLWGTEQGSCGQLFLDGEAVHRGWVLDGKRGGGGGVSAVYGEADVTGDGVNDVVIGRDNGSLEVYTLDRNGEPSRVYQRDLNEAVQTVTHGCVSAAAAELLVHTFSGKVLGMRPGADAQTIDGFALEAPRSEVQVKQADDEVKQNVAKLQQELASLARDVEAARNAYVEVSGDLIAVDGPVKILDKFQLDPETACYTLSLEAPSAMFAVAIHSNVPLDLLDVKDNAAICSRSLPDPQNGVFALATYRLQESTNRVDIKMRAIEGQAGKVRAYVMPRQSPKTCQECVYEIKPLCLHRRATRVDTAGRPMSELRIQGQFSLDDMHAWMGACLNEIPARAPNGQSEVTYEFENVLLTTVLQVTVREGEGCFRSDGVTPLALLKEFVAREATNLKMRINISYDMADASVAYFCKIVHPKLLYQLKLTGQGALVEGLKEIKMQEEDWHSFLSEEYRAILDDEQRITAELKDQPRQLDYIHGIIKDFFVDWHKFKGSNVKHMLGAIDEVLDQYSLEKLVAVIERGGKGGM